MDSWDPIVVDGLAAERLVMLDHRGTGRSSGVTPDHVPAVAGDAIS